MFPALRLRGLAGIFLPGATKRSDFGDFVRTVCPMPERAAVFLDYQNCWAAIREAMVGVRTGTPRSGQFDPLALASLLLTRKTQAHSLVGVWTYRGRPDPRRDPRGHTANLRQSQAWAAGGVHVRTRALQYPRDPDARPREKGIDVWLAVDMVRMALTDQFDVAILGTGDTDLQPAVEAVLDAGKRVEVIGWGRVKSAAASPFRSGISG